MSASPQPQVIVAERTGEGAVAALVLGVVGALLSVLPSAFVLAVALGAVGLSVGIPAARAGRRAGRRGMALTGVVLSALALTLGGVWSMSFTADLAELVVMGGGPA